MNKHVIVNIDFQKDYLQRSCGWEGRAYDLLDFNKHSKKCKVEEEFPFAPLYEGTFQRRSRVVEESY